jgi:hypothetical protein
VTRARALLALVAGCALAAAAAGNGAYLGDRHGNGKPLLRNGFLDRLLGIGHRRIRYYSNTRPSGIGQWLDVVVGGLVLLVATVVAVVVLWRVGRLVTRIVRLRFGASGGRRATEAYDPGEESADDAETTLRRRVREELTALSADLDAWPDPREAVIACYVRMERALAEAGSPRHPTESPLELVRRVLSEQHVPEPDVRRLTDLFTEARFSGHAVTDEMRSAARRSLAAVADSLGAPA